MWLLCTNSLISLYSLIFAQIVDISKDGQHICTFLQICILQIGRQNILLLFCTVTSLGASDSAVIRHYPNMMFYAIS